MEPAVRQKFLEEYAIIRTAEGRGSDDSAWYDALPYRDLSGRNTSMWNIRARSYRHFERSVLTPVERERGRGLRILDLGAGNGWMSAQLARRGHRSVALDIFRDERDGLGAVRKFSVPVSAVSAEFDCLPFGDHTFDLIIFNSSFHYSPDYRRTLAESHRCLVTGGSVVVIDSPIYKVAEHGERMRAERQSYFERTHGFRSDAMRSIEYLDEEMLVKLAAELGIEWSRSQPWYGWQWALRPWRARMKNQRPPSQFAILTGRFRT